MARIKVNGSDLHYQMDGRDDTAPVVMLSNSLASDLSMWAPQVTALTGAGYRVLRYDNRGHGGSGPADERCSIERLSGDALSVLDALDLERVHFCGLSMGGMVGQFLGTHHGDRMRSLSLCATAAYMGPRDLWDARIAAVRENGMAAVVDATIDRWFTQAGQRRLEQQVARVREGILNTTPEAYCACCAAIREMDQRDAIGSITTKTLVLVGAQDPSTTVDVVRFIHERIAGSEFYVISDAAHFLNLEQAAEFNAALLGFLEDCAA